MPRSQSSSGLFANNLEKCIQMHGLCLLYKINIGTFPRSAAVLTNLAEAHVWLLKNLTSI